MSEVPVVRLCVELVEEPIVTCGDAAVIARVWACSHVFTTLLAALVGVLTTGTFDRAVFVCRSTLMWRVVRAPMTRWPPSVDFLTVDQVAAPQWRVSMDVAAGKAAPRWDTVPADLAAPGRRSRHVGYWQQAHGRTSHERKHGEVMV